jgi:HD domain
VPQKTERIERKRRRAGVPKAGLAQTRVGKESTKSTKPPLAIPKGKKSAPDAAFQKLPFKQRAELLVQELVDNLNRNVMRERNQLVLTRLQKPRGKKQSESAPDPRRVLYLKVAGIQTEPNLKAVQQVLEAACFAAEKHAQHKRKGTAAEPYLNHLIEVAYLVSMALSEPDTNLVVAALLHDTIEDTRTTREELVVRFGSDVADLVAEVTDDKSLPPPGRKRLQIENAPKKSARAQTIKLADKISNLRGILFSPPAKWDFERKKEYFAWAKSVVDGFTAPNPILKAEFEKTLQQFDDMVRS